MDLDKGLNLTVPPNQGRQRSYQPLLAALVAAVLLLTVFNTVILIRPRTKSDMPAKGLEPDKVKDLATRLYQRNLYQQAAAAWAEYLQTADISPQDRATALFQRGLCLEKAGLFADAVEAYYRSEATSRLQELSQQIPNHIKYCLEQLGRFSALRYELMARTGYRSQDDESSKVVAEIGPERITDSDLSSFIEDAIEMELAPIAPFMTVEQLNQHRQAMLQHYKSPSARLAFLRSWLAEQIAYRRATEQGLGEQDRTKRLIDQVIRHTLAQQMIQQVLASRMTITEGDLRTYYQANKDRFTGPSKDPNQPPEVLPFEQVRDQVLEALAREKGQQIQQAFIQELMDRYQVVIHTSAFGEPNQASR